MPIITVDATGCRPEELAPAVDWLRCDGIVAFPTDTFYGLAVNPASSVAVKNLFDLKGRTARAALPLIAASAQEVERWCGRLGPIEARLADRFWPGPLSLLLDAPPTIAVEVHGGRRTIAIRVPSHPVAQAFCAAWGGLLTATSANRSGAPAAASAHALGDLAGDARLLVIDGGITTGGAPSTIVDARGSRPLVLRDGAIAWSRVLESLEE